MLTVAIIAAYEASDQRVYECPCPSCGSLFEIMWANIVWPPDEPEKAACKCAHCGQLIEEKYKPLNGRRRRMASDEAGGGRGTRVFA